jgi:hypothetical protein
VRVGVVDAGGGDVEELLPFARRGVGQVDDVEDLGAAEAGDLHGTHEGRLGECVRTNRALGAPGQGWSAAGAARPAADDVACIAAQLASTVSRSSDADPGTAVLTVRRRSERSSVGRSRVRHRFVIDATTLR